MNPRFHEALNKFMEERNPKDIDEMNQLMQEFITLYNSGKIEFEESDLVKAYDLVDKASKAKSEKTELKYLHQALEVCPYCLEAKLAIISHNSDHLKMIPELIEAINLEKERLMKEGYFKKDNVGHFYMIFETRPYIRALNMLTFTYTNLGMNNKAIDVAREILKLNNNDNTGIRYLLMALYAYKEEKNNLDKLFRKYPEDNLHVFVPYLVYYYKQNDLKHAREYFDKIMKVNPHFIDYFLGELDVDNNFYYSVGDESEVSTIMMEYEFLFDSVLEIGDFIVSCKEKEA